MTGRLPAPQERETLFPPLPLSSSPIALPDGRIEIDAQGHVIGTAIRQCKANVHVFESVGGHCQCGSEFWESPVPDTLPEGES